MFKVSSSVSFRSSQTTLVGYTGGYPSLAASLQKMLGLSKKIFGELAERLQIHDKVDLA